MKFLKITLLTSLIFAAITMVVYTSCLRNTCDNLTCFNGGSCGNGVCSCPTGYEGTQCQTLSISRFLGAYAGDISCNSQQEVIDSAFVTPDNSGPNMVYVRLKSISPKILTGYIYNNQSTYSIVVTNNDSFTTDPNTIFYERLFTITLQNDHVLSIHKYEDSVFNTASGKDTVVTNCAFLGDTTTVH